MDQLFKKWFEKQVLPPQQPVEPSEAEQQGHDGYRQPYDPYKRLQRAMQRLFPGYPTIFDREEH